MQGLHKSVMLHKLIALTKASYLLGEESAHGEGLADKSIHFSESK
jgi:hypothetical protein